MLVTGALFVGVTALVKVLGPRIPAAEAAFLRYVLGLVFLVPMIGAVRAADLSKGMYRLFATRGFLHAIGVSLWFYAMTRIPIAEVTAMNYLSPIFVTLGAVAFLGERLATRRILAIVVALLGSLIILRPGFREMNSGHIAMLATAVVFGGSYLLAKVAADRVNAAVVVFMLSVFVTLGLAPLALMQWVTPTLAELGLLFCVALLATLGHYTMTLALAAAPITVTQPVTFLQLVWATALGALAFAEPVDIWVFLGGGMILAAISFMAWREARLKRDAVTPTVPSTKL
jgi:drug/metabolite transporter (DMT)-like permease